MMNVNLAFLQEKLKKTENIKGLHGLALETESLMVQENSDWYMSIGFHCLELA